MRISDVLDDIDLDKVLEDPLRRDFPLRLPEDYKSNNPNIVRQVQLDMASGRPYHYLFQGRVGTGKTYLAEAIISSYPPTRDYYLDVGTIVENGIVKVREFYRGYLEGLKARAGGYGDIRFNERVLKRYYFCLDDLGNETPSTQPAHEYLAACLERRCEQIKSGRCRGTIITTNLNEKKIKELYGVRVMDRLQEVFQIMQFQPKVSFRREKSKPLIKG